ncbi:MAG: phosphatidylserine/phosphatidylglycerophosphate/cardiolipin synthase family protein [Candidatus Hydrothermarchaeales archaeon]
MNKRLIIVILILFSLQVVCAEEFYVTNAKTFVSPDSSYSSLKEFIDGAEKSLYISVYELDGPRIADLIITAMERGVDVEILLEWNPVGGISKIEKGVIKKLQENGAHIYFDTNDEIDFLHTKYSIADNDSVLITSENFGDTGFSTENTFGNRGWGVVIEDPQLAMYFVDIFFDDLEDSKKASVTGKTYRGYPPLKGAYKPKFESQAYSGFFTIDTVIAPENAVDELLNLLESATSSVYIEQFYIYKYWGKRHEDSVETSPNLFLEAAIDAARRGCEVKILLDATWYNVEKDDPVSNYHTIKYVNEIAKEEGLNLEAKLIDLDKAGLVKLHNKGAIVDNSKVLVSSINWNENSPTRNREAGLIIEGDVAKYYSDVFLYDWNARQKGSSRTFIVYFAISASVILGVIIFYKRRKSS